MAGPTNVNLIAIDSLRADHLGFMGYPKDITPNIDKLAKESAVFTKAFAIGPGTPCSFPAILTSTYPLDYEGPKIKEPRNMISQILKDQGYLTAVFHSSVYLSDFFGYNKGWDFFEDITPESEMWLEKKGKEVKLKTRFKMNGFLKPIERVIAGFIPDIHFRLRYLVYKSKKAEPNIKVKAEFINQLVRDLVLAKKEEQKPFFIWIHYMDVHGPYLPYLTYKENKPLSYKETVAKSFPGFLQSRFFKKIARRFIRRNLEKTIDLYDQGIRYVDEKAGELIDFLKKENIYQNSIICLAGDHGDEFMEHNEASHNNKLYNELLHVPLLIRTSAGKRQTIDKKVSLIDLAPTLCDLTGIKADSSFKGKSLFGSRISEVFHQAISPKARGISHEADIKDPKDTMVGYQSDEWKYILDHLTGKEELYNLEKDREETTNLVFSYPGIISEMREKVADFEKKNPPLNG